MLLPEGGVDLQVRCPKFLFNFMGRGIFKVGDRQAFAGGAISEALRLAVAAMLRPCAAHSWSTAASSAHAAPPSARL